MKMRSVRLGIGVAFLSAACSATASWGPATVKEQVEGSDAIAVVTITGTRALTNGDYRSVAIARVDRALKGVRGDSIALLFNSASSPEGRDPQGYSKGERCLMFMTRVSEGKYITFGSMFGKHLVKRGRVELSDGHRVWTRTLETAVKEILAQSEAQTATVPTGSPRVETRAEKRFVERPWCPTTWSLVRTQGAAAVPLIVATLDRLSGETNAPTRRSIITGALWDAEVCTNIQFQAIIQRGITDPSESVRLKTSLMVSNALVRLQRVGPQRK